MAGDWLKIEVCTPDKPEVIGIADILGLSPAHAFGSLFLVWRWFDQHTTEGNASYVTKVTIDRLSGNAGFADAMVKVGWLNINDGIASLPHFDNHNGESAKQRGLTAKRVAKSKAKSNAVIVTKPLPVALPREEKRREDIKPKPLSEYSDDFEQFWKVYPRRTGKGEANKSWGKVRPSLQTVLSSLAWQKEMPDWIKENGQFVPMPATYINQRRFDDPCPADEAKTYNAADFMKRVNGI